MNQEQLKKRLLIVVICVIVFGLFYLIGSYLKSLNKSSEQQTQSSLTASPTTETKLTPTQIPATPTYSPEVIKAINEQQKVDQQYSDWQVQIRTDYPWRKHLPLQSEKYYIYFDFDKKSFLGLLYPKAADNDNVDQMKTDIIAKLKADGIPVDSYPIEWTINQE